MAKKNIIILGAGLAGLSAAWHLQKKGIDCLVFEKEPEVGGLCRSKQVGSFTFDYDGHLLHFRHRYAFKLIKGLLADNLVEHQRNARIYYRDRYICYPFQANLYELPSPVARECLLGFLEAELNRRPKTKKGGNFLDWIKRTFGKGIARHFMIPYNTKFWTLPPEKLTCEWLDGFIPVPSLEQVIKGAISDTDTQLGYNARFWYPKRGGISAIPLALAGQIKNIHTRCRVTQIDLIKRQLTLGSGDRQEFDILISTLPLPEMAHIIKKIPANIYSLFKKLKWNSIFNLNLGIEKNDNARFHWAYFPFKDTSFFRVGFFHNFSSDLTPPGKNSLYVEVAYSQDSPVDKNRIVLRIKKDLKKIGLLNGAGRIYIEDVNDIKYAYPIYDSNYRKAREKITGFLRHNNIIPCGRYGSWQYMSMEDSILDGAKATENLRW